MVERAQIIVRGIVQGVGFRPYVFNLAESLGLKGYVVNTSDGVLVDIEGQDLSRFISRLRSEAPPLSRITDLVVTAFPSIGYRDFTIRQSEDCSGQRPFTLVSPDVSICPDCLTELLDPADRRHLYPFINCTNCGPRYSITRAVPYDRPNTTMASFQQCPNCQREYKDPRNRRFHAQPNACADCGPGVELRVLSSEFGVRNGEAIAEAIGLLKHGHIIAVKGIGGFHLACDASNDDAVHLLRERKRKSNKPFAVMMPSGEAVDRFCLVSEQERELLGSSRRPVVLLQKRAGCSLADAVSPHNQYLGVMLPYTPLHYLLFYQPITGLAAPAPHFSSLVMTSGNLAEEPIVRDNSEAMQKLSGIADAFLLHDRDIFMRVDDSVVRMDGTRHDPPGCHTALRIPHSTLSFIRRSRGYAPDPIELHGDGPEVLGCGADLKNTFTITKGRFAIPSQHIGDMENYETVRFFEESLENLKTVYRADPKVIVHDLHPGYLSTKWSLECGVRSAERGVKTVGIQHHYAHIGSVMAEHALQGKVIGVAFDGTGYGTDGNLWGGEFLVVDEEGFKRAAHFKYVPLPGGEAAIHEPWRTAVSLIMTAEGSNAWNVLEEIGFVRQHGNAALQQVMNIAAAPELSPLSSGAGRLFDAVAALLGVCSRNTFEGEAAVALEALTIAGIDEEYPVELVLKNGYTEIDFGPAIKSLIIDKRAGIPIETLATKFHNTIASIITSMAGRLREQDRIDAVALSGGTFQNRYLLNRVVAMLSSAGMKVYTNHAVPCNDGGISLGQAYLVRERLKKVQSTEFGVRSGI